MVSPRLQLCWLTARGQLCGQPSDSKRVSSRPASTPRKPLTRAPLVLAFSSGGCTATRRASATCSNLSPRSNHSRSGRRRWHRHRPHVGARQMESGYTEAKPRRRGSALGARMTRAGHPPTCVCGATACTGRSNPALVGRNRPNSSSRPLSRAPHPHSPFAEGGVPPPPPRLATCHPQSTPGWGGGGKGEGHGNGTPWSGHAGL